MPRLRPARPTPALGLGACAVALVLGTAGAAAQTADILSPSADWDANNPPPLLKRQDYGTPPGSAAGSTGFISTNTPRKTPKPSESGFDAPGRPLPPVSTGRRASVPVQPAQPPQPPQPPSPTSPTSDSAPALAPAEQTTTGTIVQRPKRKPEIDPFAPLGIRAGSFILRPAIELSGGYDSNPDRAFIPNGSSVFIVAPELKAQSDWERHELRANLRGSYTGYGSASSLNNPYFASTVDGRIDWTRRTRIELENRFLFSTENPGSPNYQADVAKPTIYTTFGGSAGLVHRFNRLEVAGKASIDRTAYRDSKLTDGSTVSNADRNLNDYGLEVRGSYELTPGVKPFVAVEADSRVHDLAVDSGGIRRDSKGITPRVGTSFELTRLLTGDVSVGYLRRSYEDPSLPELRGPIADASLAWSATPVTTLTLTAKSTAYESTDTGVSGVFARDFGAQVDHSFRRWLIGTLKRGYGTDDYVGSPRADRRYSAAADLTYKLNREVQLKGEVRREQRRSNEQGQDYTANIFLLTLRLQR